MDRSPPDTCCSRTLVCHRAVARRLKAELPASQPVSDDPGAVDVADGRIAVMRQRSVRPILLVRCERLVDRRPECCSPCNCDSDRGLDRCLLGGLSPADDFTVAVECLAERHGRTPPEPG